MQGLGEGVVIRRKFAQIDLVTPHRVLGDVFDFQLQLRLAHFFLAAGVVKIAQGFALRAQVGFEPVHLREMRRARRGDFVHGCFGELQFAAVGRDRFFRGGCFEACCSRRAW